MSKKPNVIKISIEDGDFSVFFKIPKNNFLSMDAVTIINELKHSLNVISGNEKDSQTKTESVQKTIKIEQMQNTIDEFKIRERIPNNVVDVKKLDIKQAVTEEALVRCPVCGQSHVLAVNSGSRIYVMRKFYSANDNTDEFRIIAEFDSLNSQGFIDMCCKPETNKKAYFEDLQQTKMIDDKDFAVTNETEVFCPVCCASSNFIEWKEAFNNPLNYFDTEHLCDACGGEVVTQMIKKQKINKCEKCGHETKYKGE